MLANTCESHIGCDNHVYTLSNVSYDIPIESLVKGIEAIITEVKNSNEQVFPTLLTHISCSGIVVVEWRTMDSRHKQRISDVGTTLERQLAMVLGSSINQCTIRKDEIIPQLRCTEKIAPLVAKLMLCTSIDDLLQKLSVIRIVARYIDLRTML